MTTKKRTPKIPIPRGQIEWLVNRLHVSLTADEVRAEFDKRLGDGFSAAFKKRCIEHAVRHHAKNVALFSRVMSGSI